MEENNEDLIYHRIGLPEEIWAKIFDSCLKQSIVVDTWIARACEGRLKLMEKGDK